MGKLNKIVLILLFVVVVTQTIGTGFHESAHWIQGVLDDRVEPVSIKIYPDCGVDHACVINRWTTDDPEEQKAWNAEKPDRERDAKIFNIICTTLFLVVLAKVLIWRGWL